MKQRYSGLLGLTVLLMLPLLTGLLHAPPAAAAGSGDHPGKAVFVASKCNMCHSIDSLAIARTSKSETTKGPDLSNVGAERTAQWMSAWLRRQEKIDGKAHKKSWTGNDQDLTQLVAFLGTLKKS
jgi:cytochrome c2